MRRTSLLSAEDDGGDREEAVPVSSWDQPVIGALQAASFLPVALMLETLLNLRRAPALSADPALFAAHERAAGAIARLDQALDHHPLLPAFLHRARLEAVRRQAAVDGRSIDPWHLAAVLEGLRLRMDHALRIVDRGEIFEAARTALALHQWITEPDFDQEGEVQAAECHLADALPGGLLGAAEGVWSWLQRGGTRPPIRAALIRFWKTRRLLRVPVPLTGPRALSADAPAGHLEWVVAFLEAVAAEAGDYLELLRGVEHGWRTARGKIAGRRSTSRAALAVDVLAAAPLLSATTLARAIGMSVKCATELLDRFVAAEVAVEVTHRSARRLFGLREMAPLGEAVRPPYRPDPNRGRGRPPIFAIEEDSAGPAVPMPPLAPVERRSFDYGDLEHCMAQLDLVRRQTRRSLDALARGAPAGAGSIPALGDREATDASPVPAIDAGEERDHQGRVPPPLRR